MLAKMNHFDKWIKSTDERYLKTIFDEILVNCGFGIRGFIEKQFTPFGYTALWLLSESHFAIHTFPECGKTYIELSSCVDIPFLKFKENIKQYKL